MNREGCLHKILKLRVPESASIQGELSLNTLVDRTERYPDFLSEIMLAYPDSLLGHFLEYK
ncbi:hypothetical protein LMG28138_05464 [Pararobbsia alpina]|uniref:Uncharacterized protein n=1 Tax=Pararobbsia alpina TaxID=621374 RepID=A0A6S7BMK5_9BURK|nr:hypothetical protein LMG28138_05464 [Pararobbsia alpina]